MAGRVREPHRVAIVQDWGTGMSPLRDQYDATRLAFEEAHESGLIDRPAEVEVLEVEGLPYARFSNSVACRREPHPRLRPVVPDRPGHQ